MIIWIDGTYGVGKSTIASKIMEYFSEDEAELLESDVYNENLFKQIMEEAKIKNDFFPQTGGLPQNDITFINSFRKAIEEKTKGINRKILVDMALTSRECKEGIFEHLCNTYKDVIHIILVATEDTIKSRIKSDTEREYKMLAIESLPENISFLQNNFADAIRIKTDDKGIGEVAEEIYQIIVGWEEEKQMRERV